MSSSTPLKPLCPVAECSVFFFYLFFYHARSRGGADRLSSHTERGRGGEADDGGAGEGDEGSLDQRHLLHACCSARQTARWHPGGFALQVALQEEEEVQATVVPEKEQEAEGEGESRDLKHSDTLDLGEILL